MRVSLRFVLILWSLGTILFLLGWVPRENSRNDAPKAQENRSDRLLAQTDESTESSGSRRNLPESSLRKNHTTPLSPEIAVDDSLPTLEGELTTKSASPVSEAVEPSSTPIESEISVPAPQQDSAPRNAPSVPQVSSPPSANAAEEESAEEDKALPFGMIAGIAVAAAILILLVIWGLGIAASLLRKHRYVEAGQEDAPSSDERFLSELTTLQVALLRGDMASHYEKAFSILKQILKSRRLIEDRAIDGAKTLEALKSAGVDPTYLDCVESIAHRCEAVLLHGERPDAAAHAKIEKDLRTLVRMRPHGGMPSGRKDKDRESA